MRFFNFLLFWKNSYRIIRLNYLIFKGNKLFIDQKYVRDLTAKDHAEVQTFREKIAAFEEQQENVSSFYSSICEDLST